jgi:hypothetical protein
MDNQELFLYEQKSRYEKEEQRSFRVKRIIIGSFIIALTLLLIKYFKKK